MSKRLYVAYGSNLNLQQMSVRCPTAKLLGTSRMNGFRLLFKGKQGHSVATVESYKGSYVPIIVWEITEDDEIALDRYEGWPYLYRKEIIKIELNEESLDAMIYIMNGNRPLGQPSLYYYSIIFEGYNSNVFDTEILQVALENSITRTGEPK